MFSIDDLLSDPVVTAVDSHGTWWDYAAWKKEWASRELEWVPVFEALETEWASSPTRGIRRSFIKGLDDSMDVFLASMVWGFGPDARGTSRTAKMLESAVSGQTAHIVASARRDAGSGWSALWGKTHIRGLGASFGTKLLYFAGYRTAPPPRPLVYDVRVASSLRAFDALPGTDPSDLKRDGYLAYLEWAEEQARRHGIEPDAVEYALFNGRTWLRRMKRLDRTGGS